MEFTASFDSLGGGVGVDLVFVVYWVLGCFWAPGMGVFGGWGFGMISFSLWCLAPFCYRAFFTIEV